MKIKLFLAFQLLSAAGYHLGAQDIKLAKSGNVIITGSYNKESFSGESNHLSSFINLETAEIQLKLDPTTIRTKSDSTNVCFKSTDSDKLNECLKSSDITPATLKGKLNIPFINTHKAATDEDLKFEAEFQLNGITRPIYVTGTLSYLLDKDILTCLLKIDFDFLLMDFGIPPPEGFSNVVVVQVVQALL